MTTVRDHRAEGAATTAARPVAPRTALGRITRAAGATILIAATLLAISSSWAAGTARALNTTEASQPTIAADVIKRINIERKARGLYEFTVDPELSASAQSWAEHLRDTGTFQHSDSPGETLTTMGDSAGVDNQWMRSEGHRQQILTSTETRIGIGVACDSNGNGVVVGHYAGDTGVYNVYQAQDPINGVNFEPDYTCVRPKSSTTTTQSPPTTQKSTTTTTQKPSSSTTQPTSPPPTQPQQSTTSTTKAPSGGGSTGTTQPSTPPTTAPPPPPPPPPGQATLAVTPAQSVAGQAATLAAAGACPSAGQ
ncbi:MAG TPA: CAP domain-containing protein, partial [Acidimicrobiales bacterium]|nr:CAP domain-containing protein [Acidimicrobiales bacterium]